MYELMCQDKFEKIKAIESVFGILRNLRSKLHVICCHKCIVIIN